VATHGISKVANVLLESYWLPPSGVDFQGQAELSASAAEGAGHNSVFRLQQGSDGDFWCVVAQRNTNKFGVVEAKLKQGIDYDESIELIDECRVLLPGGPAGHAIVNALLFLGEARRRDASGKRSTNFEGLERLAGQVLSPQDVRSIVDAVFAGELSFPKLDRAAPIVIQDDDDPFTRLELSLPESDRDEFCVRRIEKWSREYGGGVSSRVRAPTGGGSHDRVWRAFFVLFAAIQASSQAS
jgi:hypothetical protein